MTEVKFMKPVPYDVQLISLAQITQVNRKLFSGEAELILQPVEPSPP